MNFSFSQLLLPAQQRMCLEPHLGGQSTATVQSAEPSLCFCNQFCTTSQVVGALARVCIRDGRFSDGCSASTELEFWQGDPLFTAIHAEKHAG